MDQPYFNATLSHALHECIFIMLDAIDMSDY